MLPDAAHEARVAALARVRRAVHGDRRPAAPHLAASGRHGHLDAAARRARAGAARGDGGPADVPVGQGLVRGRRLPEDRPARARDALRRRGVRRPRSRARADEKIDLSRIPLDDPDVFAEIQAADTVGCFQIESRAQMQTILRTRPENLDDITIQVALVRPGPIQGKAVHPYIERRQKLREDPTLRAARRPPAAAASRCARRSASSSSRTRCSTSRSISPASPSARRKGCGAR